MPPPPPAPVAPRSPSRRPGPADAPAPMYPQGGPSPPGIEQEVGTSTAQEATGIGVEGETVVWEAHYAYKNFLGRFVWGRNPSRRLVRPGLLYPAPLAA